LRPGCDSSDLEEEVSSERKRSGDLARRAGELVAGAVEIRSTAPERRREELVEQAEREDGWERRLAERVYDIAREEGLHPELAYLLVRTGIGVASPEPEATADDEAKMDGVPEWVGAESLDAGELRDGRLRRGFRRLRGRLEAAGSTEEGVRAFLDEPDVGDCSY
jgi:hypothetical protein